MHYNHSTLIGRVGQDPQVRYLPDGTCVATFNIALSSSFKAPNGEWKERTDWITCKLFDKQAERAAADLHKGNLILVDGRLKTEQWNDKDTGAKRSATFVAVNYWRHQQTKAERGITSPEDPTPAPDQTPEAPEPPAEDLPF